MKRIYIVLLLAIAVFAFACKKNKDKSVSDLLQGKWYATNDQYNHYYDGQNHPDSATYNKGDVTIEFKSNLYYYDEGFGVDSGTFKVIDGPKLVFDAKDTIDIKKVTDNQLTLYTKDYYTVPTDYLEETHNYSKY